MEKCESQVLGKCYGLVTSFDDMEKGLKVLQANKAKWVATDIGERINILDEIK